MNDKSKEKELLTKETKNMSIQDLLEGVYKKKIESLLPKSMKSDHFIASAIIAIAKNSDLQNCTKNSLLFACVDAAELGLDFSQIKGWAYLVPFNDTAQLIVGYRGFIELATRYRVISRMESNLVYEQDTFEIKRGTNPQIIHNEFVGIDRGKVIGCYAVAWFDDSKYQFDYMRIDELNRIRNMAKTQRFWSSHTGEMQRKTVIRRLFKYLPLPEKLTKVIEYDNKTSGLSDTEQPQTIEQIEDEILKDIKGDDKIDEAIIKENEAEQEQLLAEKEVTGETMTEMPDKDKPGDMTKESLDADINKDTEKYELPF